jgi:hypothetical protein
MVPLWLTWISLAVPMVSYVPRVVCLYWLTWIPLAMPRLSYVPSSDLDSIGFAKVFEVVGIDCPRSLGASWTTVYLSRFVGWLFCS